MKRHTCLELIDGTDGGIYDQQNGKQGDVRSLAQANNEALAQKAEK